MAHAEEDDLVDDQSEDEGNMTLTEDGDFRFTQMVFAHDAVQYGGTRPNDTEFKLDVFDHSQTQGQVLVELGPVNGSLDDIVSVALQVSEYENALVPHIRIEGPILGTELDIYQTANGFVVVQLDVQATLIEVSDDSKAIPF
jgi:hypothetical protein